MKQKTPQTLVKVGKYDSPLEVAVRNFSEQLEHISFGLGNTVKYVMFKETEEPYLLMVSQQKDRLVTPPGYNLILTVTSYSDVRNQEIAQQFSKQTGIPLDINIPEQLKKHFAMMNLTFSAFEKNPREAISILRPSKINR